MNQSFFDFLATRRSVKPDKLSGPAPTPAELTRILTAGTRVPDHKKLAPWRFIVFEGDARARMGEHLLSIFWPMAPVGHGGVYEPDFDQRFGAEIAAFVRQN